MKEKFIRYIVVWVGILIAMCIGWYLGDKSNVATLEYYTFTSFADSSPLYVRKDCICTITTVSGDVYIVPTNGNSVRVRESMDEVREIVNIK